VIGGLRIARRIAGLLFAASMLVSASALAEPETESELDGGAPPDAAASATTPAAAPPVAAPPPAAAPPAAAPPLASAAPTPAAVPEEDFAELRGLVEEPILSTASQSLESASAAPATSTSISADDLRRFGIRSLDEAINYLALGMLTQNPLHSVDIGARGVLLTSDFGNHVLLLVNGHAMNEPFDGTAYFERGAAIPFDLIDHIEIILGPGSVLYGSNAMLGVINIITKRASEWNGVQIAAESELPTSARLALGFGHEGMLGGQPASITVALDYYRQSGPTFTFGPQNVGDDSVTMMPKKFNPAGTNAGIWGGAANQSYWTRIPAGYARMTLGHAELDVRAATYTRATPYVNDFNQSLGDFNDPDGWERDRWLSADFKYHLALSSIAELKSRLYGDLYDYRQQLHSSAAEDCLDGQVNGCRREALGLSRWAGLEEQVTLDWRHDSSLVTMLGADGRIRHVGTELNIYDAVTGDSPGPIGRDRRTEGALGVYLQQTARPASNLDLNLGLRFDADQRFGTHLSPRLAVAVRPWTGGTLKAIYSEAFRAPTLYEIAYTDPRSQVDSSGLSPEVVRSVEVLLTQRWGSDRFLIGGFRSWWLGMVSLQQLSQDQIDAAIAAGKLTPGTTSAVQYQNVSAINDLGLNASYDGSRLGGRLRFGANITIAEADRDEPDSNNVDLTVTPKVFGNARVSYALPPGFPVIGLAALFFGQRLADRANDGMFTPTPKAPAQVEARLTLSGDVPGVAGLSYRATVDAALASHNPYVVGPVQAATPDQPSAQLSPVDRFRVGVGLWYRFGK
jgi:outer membrane receptor protein involved in Fe transport